jgi:hypothetical protein
MKKPLIFLAFFLVLFTSNAISQIRLPSLPFKGGNNGFSEKEAADGIKQALEQGLVKAVLQLNKEDGFYRDALYKILLPPDAKKIEKTLRDVGMGNMVDKAILQINRGAEDAAGAAKPIFLDALKNMTLSDAVGLVKNGDTSATHFFRTKTTDKLFAAFLPIIKNSLDKTDATKYYGDMVQKYNSFPTTFKKLNPDLQSFVTMRAIMALFDVVAKEELNIRNNLSARSTDLLKKIFGR